MIFISHRSKDEDKARAIRDNLKSEYEINSFVAIYAPDLPDKLDIAKRIVAKLNECSHVIAVFSENTGGSMWVPVELGAAYQAGKGIGTYLWDDIEIPSYLNTFSIMEMEEDLNEFAELYLKDRRLNKSILNESARYSAAEGPDTFIRALKSRLGQ